MHDFSQVANILDADLKEVMFKQLTKCLPF